MGIISYLKLTGVYKSLELIYANYWWPTLILRCGRVLYLCTNKVSHFGSIGLLQFLPIPDSPWTHIAIDFITGLQVWRSSLMSPLIFFPTEEASEPSFGESS